MRGTLFCVSAVLVSALVLAGCSAESHKNDPRPPVVPVVSVSVTAEAIEVAPRGIGLPGQLPVNLNQNWNAPVNQADPEDPAVVDFRISNITRLEAPLVLEGPVDKVYPMAPSSPASFTAGLRTGIYRLSSPASSGTALLLIGPSRISSAGDVLTP
ncbi:MAG: hypothetical protein WD181_04095 [Solirubrobacterales bacterium]